MDVLEGFLCKIHVFATTDELLRRFGMPKRKLGLDGRWVLIMGLERSDGMDRGNLGDSF